jgi:DNA polymerase-3 subunit delta'
MSLPEPRANPLLLGHVAAERTVVEAMRGGRMHHAWLITGSPGIGKATLAFRFARRLLAGQPDGDTLALDEHHPVFRRVAAASHADMLTVERAWNEKTKRLRGEIVAEDTRSIADFLHLTPAEGGWRVVVVDGAEDLNRHAANALLKVLEEPPPRAVLLLVSAAPGRLLPTIRSRCRRLALEPLDEATMQALLARALPEAGADERTRLATIAEGSPGRALALAAAGGVAMATLVDKVLADLPGEGGDPARAVQRANEIADTLGREEGGFATFFALLRAAVAAAVRDAGRGRADPDQRRLLGKRSLEAWVDVWQALTRLAEETERFHLDARQAVAAGLALLAQPSGSGREPS